MNLDRLGTSAAPHLLSVLRIMSALIFMAHGTSKLLGFPPPANAPAAFSLSWTAGLLELVGGALLALGLFTRPVAFILSGEMAFAYFIDAAILYCFVFLYIAAAGPGPWSLDAKRSS